MILLLKRRATPKGGPSFQCVESNNLNATAIFFLAELYLIIYYEKYGVLYNFKVVSITPCHNMSNIVL